MAPFMNSILYNQNSKSYCLRLKIAWGALFFTPSFWIPTKTVILESPRYMAKHSTGAQPSSEMRRKPWVGGATRSRREPVLSL